MLTHSPEWAMRVIFSTEQNLPVDMHKITPAASQLLRLDRFEVDMAYMQRVARWSERVSGQSFVSAEMVGLRKRSDGNNWDVVERRVL